MDFSILGPLEARLESRLVRIKGGGQRALLARLLLDANRVVSVDRLLVDLWVAPPGSGVRALHQRVVQLRRSLDEGGVGEPMIVTQEPGYVIKLKPAETRP